MPEVKMVEIASIVVNRDLRQRRELNVDDLITSIQLNEKALPETMGLIQPIVLRNGTTLVAGERRLTAFKNLGRSKIPAIAIESLDDRTAYILELEENLRRADISWQERSKAFKAIHDSFLVDDPEWTQVKTAARLGVSEATVTMYISLAEEMVNDPNLRTIPKATTAYETIKRRVDRQLDDVLVSMPLAVRNVVIPPQLDKSNLMARAPVVPEAPKHMAAGSSLINADFIEWAANYKGPRFNLIHCDFPYGAAAGKKGSQIHAGGSHRSYEDSDDIFWELMDALFVPNIIAQSAHILLWYQTSEFRRVMGYLEGLLLDLRVLDVPLIWHKSDNSGVVADASRRPRHIYENALLISRGDRKIVSPVSDVHSCPITRAIHPSEKPEPMLRYFFKMLVSSTTRMLDPTAGSGTSLRAAESLGAEFVFGLERDEHFHGEAVAELERFRKKRAAEQLEGSKE